MAGPWSFFPEQQREVYDHARAHLGLEDPPTFTGIFKGSGMGVMRGGARAGEGLGLATAGVVRAMSVPDPQRQAFAELMGLPKADAELSADSMSDPVLSFLHNADLVGYWTPKPEEVGTAGRIIGGLGEIALPLAAGGLNPTLLIGGVGLTTGKALVDEGVQGEVALKGSAIATLATGVGVMIPFYGSTAASKIITGATSNVALGAGADTWVRSVLEEANHLKAAERFDPLNLEARGIELLVGAAFGGLAHWAAPLPASVVATANAQKHVAVDTAIGRPANVDAQAAHVEAMSKAQQQAARGEPIDIGESIERLNMQRDKAMEEVRESIRKGFEEQRLEMFGPEAAARIAKWRELHDFEAAIVRMKGEDGLVRFNEIFAEAAARNDAFEAMLRSVAGELGGEAVLPGLKARARAAEKVAQDYAGDATRLKDLLRGTIAVDDIEAALGALDHARARFRVLPGSERNLLVGQKTIDGYRDIKMNVDLGGGVVGEVQINLRSMMKAKVELHALYERISRLERSARSAGRDFTPAEAKEIGKVRSEMKRSYDAAWRAAINATRSRKADSSMGVPFLRKEEISNLLSAGSKARTARPSSGKGIAATGTPSTSANSVPSGNFSGKAIPGIVTEALTARGDRVPVQYAIVEAGTIRTSHDDALRPAADYPAELQPRDRTRAASEEQVSRIAQSLDPSQVLESPFAYTGAPIVGPDGVVESGNARTIGIRRAYRTGMGDAYRLALGQAATGLGLESSAVVALKEPVLVRIRRGDVDRVRFAVEANEPPVQAMSVTERAQADASLMPALRGLEWNEDGTLDQGKSMGFLRAFAQHVVGPADRNAFMLPDGTISVQGLARVRNAIFAAAYDDAELVQRMAESPDPITRNTMHALTRVAGRVAELKEAIVTGDRFALDPSQDLAAAARLFAALRENSTPVDAYLGQGALFAGHEVPPMQAALLKVFDENARSAVRTAMILDDYLTAVERLGSPKQGDLMGGERQAPDPMQILGPIVEKARRELEAARAPEKEPELELAFQTAQRNPGMVIPDETGTARSASELLLEAEEGIAQAAKEAEAVKQVAPRYLEARNESYEDSGRPYQMGQQLELDFTALDFDATPAAQVPRKLERILGRGRVIAAQFAEDLRNTASTDIIGAQAPTPRDLALAAQIFRHPQYETFRSIFVDEAGKIVHATGATLRAPGETTFHAGRPGDDAYFTTLRAAIKEHKAAGVYMLHNHPSGRAEPSAADRYGTSMWQKHLGAKLKGHVVIDHNEWAFIEPGGGRAFVHKEDLGAAELAPAVMHPLLGRVIDSPDVVRQIARELAEVRKPDVGILVTRNHAGKITSLLEIPNEALRRRDARAAAELRQWARRQSAGDIFYIGDDWRQPHVLELTGEKYIPRGVPSEGYSQAIGGVLRDTMGWDGGKTAGELSLLEGRGSLRLFSFNGKFQAPDAGYDVQRAAATLGRSVADSEVKNIGQRVMRQLRYLMGRRAAGDPELAGLGDEQIRGLAVDNAANEVLREANLKKRRVALTILAHDRLLEAMRAHRDGMMRGLKSLMTRDVEDRGTTLSAEGREKAIKAEAMSSILSTLEASHPKFFGLLENPTGVLNILREIWKEGSSGDADAAAGAKAWREMTERLRVRLNGAGGDIGHLQDWNIPQVHDRTLVTKAGFDKWVGDILPKLDRRRYVHEDGRPYTDEDMRGLLAAAYETIRTDGFNKVLPGSHRGTGAVANRGAAHREIHFKTADDYFEYHRNYGASSLYNVMLGHVAFMARAISLVETFGPNPRQMFQYLHDVARKAGYEDKGLLKASTLFEELIGDVNVPESETLARFGQGLRNVEVFSKLGGAALSSVTDFATVQITAAINRLPEFRLLANQLKALNPLDRNERALARRAGLALETMISELNRFGEEGFGHGWTGKLSSFTMRASGLAALTDANKRAFGTTMMSTIGDLTRKPWAEVDPADVRILKTYGVTEREWQVWQRATLEDWGSGNKLLTPTAIMRIGDEQLADLAEAAKTTPLKLRNEAMTKLLGAVLEEGDIAVVTAGLRERAIVKQGSQAGTIPGEIMRTLFLFKSFPVGMIARHWMRGIGQETAGGKTAYIASLLVGTTVLGALAMTAKDVAAGKDPRDFTDWKSWLAAFAQGGGLGIYGDFIAQDANRFGQSFLASLAGPFFGSTLEQLYDLTLGNAHEAMRGKDPHFAAEGARFLRSHAPLVNLWYLKAALDHAVFHQAQEYLSPGYLAEMQRRIMRDTGQTFWWTPGPGLPDRAPDAGKALGR